IPGQPLMVTVWQFAPPGASGGHITPVILVTTPSVLLLAFARVAVSSSLPTPSPPDGLLFVASAPPQPPRARTRTGIRIRKSLIVHLQRDGLLLLRSRLHGSSQAPCLAGCTERWSIGRASKCDRIDPRIDLIALDSLAAASPHPNQLEIASREP